jgi:SAM-dependent methyltransferase
MSAGGGRTIADFGEQWTKYQDNLGYYGSVALFEDVFAPLLTAADLAGKRVADIGAGTGRFVNIFLDAGASHVVAIEPSAAFDVLKRNTGTRESRVTYLQVTGDRIPPDLGLDYAFSIGVLHHIPEPRPVLLAAVPFARGCTARKGIARTSRCSPCCAPCRVRFLTGSSRAWQGSCTGRCARTWPSRRASTSRWADI